MSKSALDFAHYFIRKGLDQPRNTKKGNMKIQKLLYFSQLVHLSKYKRPLFDDHINAYENGCVVEDVMNAYNYEHSEFIEKAYTSEVNLSDDEIYTLEIVSDIFGSISANELSDINHTHECWKIAYNRSYVNERYKEKNLSKVDIEDMKKYDLSKIDDLIRSFTIEDKNYKQEVIIIDGTEFYYEPSEITMDDNMKQFLMQFVGREEVYTIYKDPSQGVVIY